LVARSTSDQVDVAKVAARFGGGGHERAAAALIKVDDAASMQDKRKKLAEIQASLTALLPEFVQPSITVGQIMSRKPKLLSPDAPVQEAALLMQRFGYEGYPVVHNGKIIGLLTRRAVDRALAHKLNLPASSLMEAGDVKVLPTDSLQYLQMLMAETGWGQIPVVDPATEKVIGIVTRTDLLKTLAGGESSLPGRKNLRSKLEAALPPSHMALLQLIAAQAAERHLPIYIVGGFVRDLILDRSSLDFDIVVEGEAIQFARALSSRFGGRIVSHSRFGTAKWWITEIAASLKTNSGDTLPDSLDLISARSEFYEYPTALPTIERSGIKLDLHRRDFTINTLALRLDGRHQGDLYDYWGGLNDLHKGLVRVLHSLSFIDDPTRMLRAVRFEQRFGFSIEQRTLELMEDARPLLHQVSGDRLRHELNLIFLEDRAPAMMDRLEQLGLLSAIHPDLCWRPEMAGPIQRALNEPLEPCWNLPDQIGHLTIRQLLAYLNWLLAMQIEKALRVVERLRLPGEIRSTLIAADSLRRDLPGLEGSKPSILTERIEQVPAAGLYALYLHGTQPQTILTYTQVWRSIKPHNNGHALRQRGILPGPEYRQILTLLRTAWLDGEISSSIEEKAYLDHLLQTH
jgi:tRNA nucleotidyltransferase (CCA-adding enzyme)